MYKGFTSVKLTKPPRSFFDLSHDRRSSTRMGKLTPIFITETLPNDTFKARSEILCRFAPMIVPIMHRVNVFVHWFFVPNRILWSDWELFITGGRLGTETPPVPPCVKIDDVLALELDLLDERSLADHMCMATIGDGSYGTWGDRTMDILPFIGYSKIWYDYYRDRNFEADSDYEFPLGSGSLVLNSTTIPRYLGMKTRMWQHDYFTSALPFTQRGDEVLLPIQGSGEVTYLPTSLAFQADGDPATAGNVTVDGSGNINTPAAEDSRIENIDQVNITQSEVSMNDFRVALALQKWMERNALAGSRYNESIMAHFNRRTSDGRLQRAEYLGGGKVTVKISEVVNTAYSIDNNDNIVPPANMSGHGFVVDGTNGFTYNCEEHGFIMAIASVMPTSGYITGAHRMYFGRNSFLDYPWPVFAHLGEQEVKKYELWITTTTLPVSRAAQPLFGYQSRYADWKHIRSSVHGSFRSTMNYWHLNRKFASEPTLSATFNRFEDSLQDRVFAVSGEVAEGADVIWLHIYNNVSVVRSLPYYGTPTL